MTLFELIFILLFLGSVVGLLLSAFLWRRGASRKILRALGLIWGVYLVVLGVTDAIRPQKVFKSGEDECFDEMCFAVVDAQMFPTQTLNAADGSGNRIYVVKVRATSHSRGRAQAEGGLRGRLYGGGTYLNASGAAQRIYDARFGESPRLTQKIGPGESVLAVLVFEVPQSMAHAALALDHGFTPGYFVIGESPFFHEPDVHALQVGP